MPAQVLNGPAIAVHMYQALFGQAPSNALYNSYVSQVGSTDGAAFAAAITGSFASTSNAALSTLVLKNLGVTATTMPATATVTAAAAYTALETALTSMFTGYGVAARGQIILNMTNLLANLEGDVTFGTIASTYNTQTLTNFTYSSNVANTTSATSTVATTTTTTGQTFTLTDKIGESIVGTANNDTFKAVVATGVASDSTLNLGDTIDGGAGKDTLNVTVLPSSALPNGASIANIEVINLDVTSAGTAGAGTAFLKSSAYVGVQELWQANTGSIGAVTSAKFAGVTVGEGVIAGYRGNGVVEGTAAATASGAADASVTVTAASATQKALTVALDGIGSTSTLTFAAASTGKIETITITGSVAGETASAAGKLAIDAGADALTVNGAFTSNVNINGMSGAKIKTIDFSSGAGAVELNATGLTKLESLKGGIGNDKLTVNLAEVALVVDAGAGNDTITLTDGATGATVASTFTLGAGKDTLVITAALNVVDTADLTKGLVTVTDFKIGDDTVNLNATGVTLTAGQLGTAKDAASLKAAIDYVATQTAFSKAAVFGWGGDAYVFVNDATAGFAAGDGLIKLVGVDATLLSTTQNGGLVL